MIQRLLEFWLDNIGERGYQGPFLQMLTATGYTVLHSTRHVPIEFGKDVIAYDPQGRLTAFQLKGKPHGQFTLHDLREVQPQLIELSAYAVRFPGIDPAPPRPILVVNAQVEELAQRAIDDLNAGQLKSNPIEVWPYGKLFDMASSLAADLWPTGIPDTKELLKILTEDEKGPFPIAATERLVLPMLGLGAELVDWKAAEFERRIASAGLLIGICVARAVETKNHASAIQAWTLCAGLIAACRARYGEKIGAVGRQMFDLAIALIDESLVGLAAEVTEARDLLVLNALSEGGIYPARINIVGAYLAALWFRGRVDQNVEFRDQAKAALLKVPEKFDIWGEAAIVPILARLWVLDNVAQANTDRERIVLLGTVLHLNSRGAKRALAPPYYDFETVCRERMSLDSHRGPPFDGFTFEGFSHLALGLFEEIVRANLKQSAKQAWRPLTRLQLMQVDIPEAWQFPLSRASSAKSLTRILPPSRNWCEVLAEAYDRTVPALPDWLVDRPDVVLLIALLYPHRASPSVLRYLGLRLGRPWYPATQDARL